MLDTSNGQRRSASPAEPARQRRSRAPGHIARTIITIWLVIGAIIVLMSAVLLLAGSFLADTSAPLPWAPLIGSTTSMEPVEIDLYGEGPDGESIAIPLSVPKAYLSFRSNWSGGRQDFVVVEAHLRDLRPWSIAKPEALEPVSSQLYMTLKASLNEYATRLIRAVYTERLEYQGEFRLQREDGSDDVFDLYRNRLVQRPDGSFQRSSADEYLMPRDVSGRPDFFFICRPSDPGADVRCTGNTDFRPNLRVEYSFSQTLLPHWREIEDKARQLVENFLAL